MIHYDIVRGDAFAEVKQSIIRNTKNNPIEDVISETIALKPVVTTSGTPPHARINRNVVH